MARIDAQAAGDSYRVIVDEDGSWTSHDVTVGDDLVDEIGVDGVICIHVRMTGRASGPGLGALVRGSPNVR